MRLPKQSGSFAILLSLTENADQQQKKEFLDELELMKPMVPHPNIVGLVGCCTKSGEWRELKYFVCREDNFLPKKKEWSFSNKIERTSTITDSKQFSFTFLRIGISWESIIRRRLPLQSYSSFTVLYSSIFEPWTLLTRCVVG